jgi:hypothetical protein
MWDGGWGEEGMRELAAAKEQEHTEEHACAHVLTLYVLSCQVDMHVAARTPNPPPKRKGKKMISDD